MNYRTFQIVKVFATKPIVRIVKTKIVKRKSMKTTFLKFIKIVRRKIHHLICSFQKRFRMYQGKVMLTQNLFVDADTNRDGLVSKASFSKLNNMAATILRMYGYAPPDAELYKTLRKRSSGLGMAIFSHTR